MKKATFYQIHRENDGIYGFIFADGAFVSISYHAVTAAPDALKQATALAVELIGDGYEIEEKEIKGE